MMGYETERGVSGGLGDAIHSDGVNRLKVNGGILSTWIRESCFGEHRQGLHIAFTGYRGTAVTVAVWPTLSPTCPSDR